MSNKHLFRHVKSIRDKIHFFENIPDQNNIDYHESNNMPAIPRVDATNERAYIYDINAFISSQQNVVVVEEYYLNFIEFLLYDT